MKTNIYMKDSLKLEHSGPGANLVSGPSSATHQLLDLRKYEAREQDVLWASVLPSVILAS